MLFQRKPEPVPLKITNYEKLQLPTGLVVQTDVAFYYIKNDVRIKISDKVLASWRVVNVPTYHEDALTAYPIKGWLPYRDGSVLKNYANGLVYYVSAGRLRHVTNPDWEPRLGYDINDIIEVSQEEINQHRLGEPLD